jgi:hypothetical protein
MIKIAPIVTTPEDEKEIAVLMNAVLTACSNRKFDNAVTALVLALAHVLTVSRRDPDFGDWVVTTLRHAIKHARKDNREARS